MQTGPRPPPSAAAPPPPARDPGLRFVAPADRPRVAGTMAEPVLRAAGLPVRLDRDMALLLLLHDEYDVQRSFFAGLRVVPARVPIRRRGDGTLEVEGAQAPKRLDLSFREAVTRIRAAVGRAVESVLQPHARVGVWLSGGVDSSAVAAAAVEAWRALGRDPDDLLAYHLLHPEGPSEVEAAGRVAAALGTKLHTIEVPPGDPFDGAEAFFPLLDAPPDGGGPAATLTAARRMADDGVDVFLTGDGGDEVFGELAAVSPLRRVASLVPPAWHDALRRARGPRDVPAWLADRVGRRALLRTLPRPRRGLRGRSAERDRRVRCARQAHIVGWLRATGRAVGLDAHAPLLDASVTDAALAVAPAHHERVGVEKPLLRSAFADVLARAWGSRTKRDQPYHEERHTRVVERHRSHWAGRLRGGVLERCDLVPRAGARQVLEDASTGDVLALYRALSLVALELWCDARDVG